MNLFSSCSPPSSPGPGRSKVSCSDPGFASVSGSRCLVTGSSGLVGCRLVSMLLDRGCREVVAFDLREPGEGIKEGWERRGKVTVVVGDLARMEDLEDAVGGGGGIDCVYHIGALVGPFHPKEMFLKVNYEGTKNVVELCRKRGIPKIVFSSSPSTRFDGGDVRGLREDQLRVCDEVRVIYFCGVFLLFLSRRFGFVFAFLLGRKTFLCELN